VPIVVRSVLRWAVQRHQDAAKVINIGNIRNSGPVYPPEPPASYPNHLPDLERDPSTLCRDTAHITYDLQSIRPSLNGDRKSVYKEALTASICGAVTVSLSKFP